MSLPIATRIAVLIPVYNSHHALEMALDSLAANDEPHDVIVVDDGSTPPLKLSFEQHPNVHVIRLQQNVGITRALNYGLGYILDRGYDYVARLDADDVALPNRLSIQRIFMDQNFDVAVVGGWGEVVSEEGTPIFCLNHPTEHEEIVRKLHHNNCFLHPSLMFRSAVFRDAGLYSEDYPCAEDYELMFRLASNFRTANLSQYVIRYTLTNTGISISKRNQQLSSRLKIQWKYRNFSRSDFYLGVLRTIILKFMSRNLVIFLKQRNHKYSRFSE